MSTTAGANSATMNMEKRRYVRYELLDYALLDLHGMDEQVSVVVTDIGLGGIQVRTKGDLEKGLSCHVRIACEDGNEYLLPGEIRHSATISRTDLFAIGIRFTPISHEERIAVAEFVHAIFRRQADSLTS